MTIQRASLLILVFVLAGLSVCTAQSSSQGSLVITQGNDKCIETQNGSLKNGVKQWIRTCTLNSAAQTWQFVAAKTSGRQVLRTANGYCLDVPDGVGAQGKQVQIWKCNLSSKNQFFARDGNMIRWNRSQYCLDVANGSGAGYRDGLMVQLWTCDGGNANMNIAGPQKPNVIVIAPTPVPTTTTTMMTTTIRTTFTAITTSPTPIRYGKPSLTSVFDPSRKRMLAWGYDNNAAPLMANGAKIGSYHHWEDDKIPQMPARVAYIPTYWGTTKTAQWTAVKNTLGGTVPGAVMGFNEPDIASQANMDPQTAANVFYSQITQVYGVQGANMISPGIVWNVDGWLTPFMSACDKLGCGIDAIGYHIYIDLAKDAGGSVDKAVGLIQSRITSLYNKFGKPIVLSELGLTQAGGGTDAQLTDFMVKSARFLDNSPYVLAWALSAVFRKGSGWDGYLNSNLAFFDANGTVSTLGKRYMDETF